MLRLTVIMGTRPEIIKMAPIIHAARKAKHDVQVVLTGQHKEMVGPLLKAFDLSPDLELAVMVHNQGLAPLSEKILARFNENKKALMESDFMVVQGDTTSAFIAAYWGFCNRISVAHIEAGLRTYDLTSPYPEEGNRQLIARIAAVHFAPTSQAAEALHHEKVENIHNVGNTSIDALHFVLDKIKFCPLSDILEIEPKIIAFIGSNKLVVVTAHRRESFGDGFEGICEGILNLVGSRRNIRVVYPVHPNPNVRELVWNRLGLHPQILLCEPLGYVGFVALLRRADVILTDSGGIQEEGPTLRKPIVVMREKTERPEGVAAGFSILVGTDPKQIVRETLNGMDHGLKTHAANPYGDGFSATRIIEILAKRVLADQK